MTVYGWLVGWILCIKICNSRWKPSLVCSANVGIWVLLFCCCFILFGSCSLSDFILYIFDLFIFYLKLPFWIILFLLWEDLQLYLIFVNNYYFFVSLSIIYKNCIIILCFEITGKKYFLIYLYWIWIYMYGILVVLFCTFLEFQHTIFFAMCIFKYLFKNIFFCCGYI